jgi:hypothetical protein
MGPVIAHPEGPLNQLGDALGGPKVCAVAVGLGPRGAARAADVGLLAFRDRLGSLGNGLEWESVAGL